MNQLILPFHSWQGKGLKNTYSEAFFKRFKFKRSTDTPLPSHMATRMLLAHVLKEKIKKHLQIQIVREVGVTGLRVHFLGSLRYPALSESGEHCIFVRMCIFFLMVTSLQSIIFVYHINCFSCL